MNKYLSEHTIEFRERLSSSILRVDMLTTGLMKPYWDLFYKQMHALALSIEARVELPEHISVSKLLEADLEGLELPLLPETYNYTLLIETGDYDTALAALYATFYNDLLDLEIFKTFNSFDNREYLNIGNIEERLYHISLLFETKEEGLVDIIEEAFNKNIIIHNKVFEYYVNNLE